MRQAGTSIPLGQDTQQEPEGTIQLQRQHCTGQSAVIVFNAGKAAPSQHSATRTTTQTKRQPVIHFHRFLLVQQQLAAQQRNTRYSFSSAALPRLPTSAAERQGPVLSRACLLGPDQTNAPAPARSQRRHTARAGAFRSTKACNYLQCAEGAPLLALQVHATATFHACLP